MFPEITFYSKSCFLPQETVTLVMHLVLVLLGKNSFEKQMRTRTCDAIRSYLFKTKYTLLYSGTLGQ
jgi:hypothetical protein